VVGEGEGGKEFKFNLNYFLNGYEEVNRCLFIL